MLKKITLLFLTVMAFGTLSGLVSSTCYAQNTRNDKARELLDEYERKPVDFGVSENDARDKAASLCGKYGDLISDALEIVRKEDQYNCHMEPRCEISAHEKYEQIKIPIFKALKALCEARFAAIEAHYKERETVYSQTKPYQGGIEQKGERREPYYPAPISIPVPGPIVKAPPKPKTKPISGPVGTRGGKPLKAGVTDDSNPNATGSYKEGSAEVHEGGSDTVRVRILDSHRDRDRVTGQLIPEGKLYEWVDGTVQRRNGGATDIFWIHALKYKKEYNNGKVNYLLTPVRVDLRRP
jgi:hypothetical protein